MRCELHLSIPASWLKRTDQSVLAEAPFWLEVDQPVSDLPAAARGLWTVYPEMVPTLHGHPHAAGPPGSGLPGAIIGSIDDLEKAADARFLLLNGEDAAGNCGEQGLFVLMQAVIDDPRPVWIRGAVGPALVAAAREAGFAGVLAEEIVWPGLDALPASWRDFWQSGSPGETRCFGAPNARIRFWAKPGFAVTREAVAAATGSDWDRWRRAERATPERPGPKDAWVPAGGATGLAERYGIRGAPVSRLAQLNRLADGWTVDAWPWRSGAGWARRTGIDLPLSQGPMANVSDVPAFAEAISRAGGFPWFALASTPEGPVRELLEQAASLPQPWGAGIIGMSTNPMLEDHIRLCREAGVRWLLVAAGTASLAARLIQEGFEVVLHTPAPEMLEAALQAGVRHVIWEGREAGGHVGTLNSWTLWQHNLAVLESRAEQPCSVLLAGGIGTSASARLTAPLGARLEQRGHAQGLQIGSAYLRTQEAVTTGAIARTYATALQQTGRTIVAGDQSGAPTRLLATARALELAKQEQEWIRAGLRIHERKHRFERANFGGLRLAAKAQRVVIDDHGPRLERVHADESLASGLFHIGENAALPLPADIASLHAGLTRPPAASSSHDAPRPDAATAHRPSPAIPEDAVAVIGMSFWLPGAADDEAALWQMLAEGRHAIDDVANHDGYWNPDLFWDPEGTHPEKSYSRIGGFIDDPPFDGRRFRIPPRVATALDRTQLLGLMLAERAFLDAGLTDPSAAGGACDVVLGIAQGDLRTQTDARILLDALALAGNDTGVTAIEQQLGFRIPEPVADSMAGELANCCAGRIAAAFDLHGANFTTDAACASALAAIGQAVDRLRLGRCDIALTGGLDRNMSVGAYVKFCRLGALSREGSYPFDARASGFVMGEGGALFVLKRLRDALRDGDRIRAVIRGVGLASDGRGKGITAPNPAGQRLAVERAWKDAGVGPDDLGYIEAHGTGTPVGDKAETATLHELFSDRKTPLPIGSIKGNIGHLKAAAGAAGLARTILMLERRAIAPSGGYAQPRPELGFDASALYVADHLQEWEGPLRAGVSAFGFGGTNAHIVVEALAVDDHGRRATVPTASTSSSDSETDASLEAPEATMNTQTMQKPLAEASITTRIREIVADASGYDLEEIEPDLDFEADLGIDTVKIAEIIGLVREAYDLPEDPDLVLSDVSTVAAVAAYVTKRLDATPREELDDKPTQAADAVSVWRQARSRLRVFRAGSREALAAAIDANREGGQGDWGLIVEQERYDRERLLRGLDEQWNAGRWQRAGASLGRRSTTGTAWLFPGQGTQQPGMLAELRGEPVIDQTIAEAAEILDPLFDVPLETLLAPPASEADAQRIGALLRQTRYTQPVLLTVEIALMRLLQEAGWRPGAVAGHSLGEFGACVAAGVLSFADALRIVSGRGRAMEEAAARIDDPGAMVAVGLDRIRAAELLERLGLRELELANQNSPSQTVIGGATAQIDRLCDALQRENIRHKRLNVSHAFHTSIVAAASAPLREMLAKTDLHLPHIPIYSNVTARPYPDDVDEIRELLAIQLARPVRFVEMIEDMAARGIPGFIEVGAGRVLSGLAAEIVDQRLPAVPSYLPGQDPVATLARVVAVQETVAGSGPLPFEQPAGPPTLTDASRAPQPTAPVASAASGDDVLDAVRRIVADASGYELEEIEPDLDFEADLGIDTVKIAEIVGLVRERFGLPEDPDLVLSDVATARAVTEYVVARVSPPTVEKGGDGLPTGRDDGAGAPLPSASAQQIPEAKTQASDEEILSIVRRIVADASGYELEEIEPDLDFEADLGIDTVKIAEIIGLVRERFGLPEDPDLVLSDVATAEAVARYVAGRRGATTVVPAQDASDGSTPGRAVPAIPNTAVPALAEDEIVIAGVAAAIPGHPDPFSEEALDSLLSGNNHIEPVSAVVRERIIELGIESLSKDSDGRVRTQVVRDPEETIQYRSRLHGEPDLTAFGIPKAAAQVLDRSSRWAVAAGFHALRDAALPLIERASGDRYAAARVLPPALGARTGVIYASIFGGLDVWVDVATGQRPFPRTFMVEALSLAHSHFARFVGATGPTMRVDAACASTVNALATAQDWLRNDRCDRVVILACDLAGEDTLLPYVGGGFMAVGAASTDPDLEQAARPFGTGRSGTIIGSAALAIVLEKAAKTRERGLRPHARLAAVRTSNDACHPLQMNPERIAEQLDNLIETITDRYDLDRTQLARRGAFVSHEPFTPARGGSAASEANALRRAFGAHVGEIPVINVKGYTGHPMAASIEDIVAIAALVRGKAPAVRNADKQDPELADLRLSDGRPIECDWVIHLAAGFGAQIGWVGYGRVPGEGPRLDEQTWRRWTETLHPAATHHAREEAHAGEGAAVLSWLPHWRKRNAADASVTPGAVFAPLTERTVLDADDVERITADVISRCVQQRPGVVALPAESADRWTRIAAEAIAAAVRSLRKETGGPEPRLVWCDGPVPDRLLDVGEQRWRKGQVWERLWVPNPQRNARATAPEGNWILIGGGRGITGLLARRWAAVGGRTLVLVGRQDAPDDRLADLDDAALKQRARAELEGQKDPKRYQVNVLRLERARELARTLRELRNAPAEVLYVAADIAAPGAAERIAAAAGEMPIAGIVHAAGVEASASAERTSADTVRQVLTPKLRGGLEVLRLAERLGGVPVIGFGSIAAAIGNHGQSAYGAANAALRALLESASTPALTIEWSAWDGAGMATRGAIPELLKRQGISLMRPDAAFSELEAWLSVPAEQRPSTVVVAAAGDAGRELPEPPADAAACVVSGPGDPWIDDHRIGGTAVQPGVSGLEMLWRLRPDEGVALDFRRPIRFAQESDALISIVNHNGHGRVVEHDDTHRPRRQPAWTYTWKGNERPDAPAAFPEDWEWCCGPGRTGIYALLFHGPRFQILDDSWLAEGGAFATATIPASGPEREHAMTVEAMFQLAGLWGAWKHGKQYLPVRVWTHEVASCARPGPGTVRIACIGGDEEELHFQGAWHDLDGELLRTAEFALRAAGTSERPHIRTVGGIVEIEPVEDADDRRAAHRRASSQAWQRGVARLWTALTGQRLDPIETPEAPGPLRIGSCTIAWSRTHSDRLAAAVVRPGGAIGIDAETIADRPAAFWEQAASAQERRRFPQGPSPLAMTMVWTAKEATLKAAGTGLSIPLADLDVNVTGPDSAVVTVAERQRGALGFAQAFIQYQQRGETLVALAQPDTISRGI